MIYRKDANFPYPVLSNSSNAYKEHEFQLLIDLQENGDFYRFHLDITISSDYLQDLIREKKAKVTLIIQSKDNKFFYLNGSQTYVDVPRNRISLNKRTQIQLMIMANEELTFADNHDLIEFYDQVKSEIQIAKYSILGYSNVVVFDGSCRKPLELFEKRVNPELRSDIKIEFGSETIIINYRDPELQFGELPKSNQLNHHYVYMGLQKALYRFIMNNRQPEEDIIYLDDMDVPSDTLDMKLYNLMTSKMVEELSMDNIDEVICMITDHILTKFTATIKGLYKNED